MTETTQVVLTGQLFDKFLDADNSYASLFLTGKIARKRFSGIKVNTNDLATFPSDLDYSDFSILMILEPKWVYTLKSEIYTESPTNDSSLAFSSFKLTTVPVPAGVWLFFTSLLSLAAVRKIKSAQ